MNDSARLKVLSIGECIPEGLYHEIFSSHVKAVNFVCQNQVISLCNKEISPGAFRIVLDLEDVAHLRSLSVGYGEIGVNGHPCAIPAAAIYRAPQFQPVLADAEFQTRLWGCFRLFQRRLPEQSVAYLLKKEDNTVAAFDQALASVYRDGIQLFRVGKFQEGCACFKGRGYGLTPGGDDFLAGFLLGLRYKQNRQRKSLSDLMDLIFYESLSENYLSNTFLLQAYHLLPDRDWADFLQALESDTSRLPEAMAQICAHGATSGYDTLSGFFAAWEIL